MLNICLFVEILSQEQSANVLELLQFLISPGGVKSKISRKVEGYTVRGNTTSINHFIEAASQQKHNQISVTYNIPSERAKHDGLILSSVDQVLEVSPTNALWASTKLWPPQKTANVHKVYKTCQSHEYHLKWNEVTLYPSCLTTTIFMKSYASEREVPSQVLDFLAMCLAKFHSSLDISGAACMSIADEKANLQGGPPLILANLQRWPKSYPMLGARFDALHPYLIGSSKLCNSFLQALDERAELSKSISANGKANVVYLPNELLADPISTEKSSGFLVPKDASTAGNEFGDASKGEYIIGKGRYCSKRRYNQLIVEDRIVPLNNLQRLPVIDPKYLAMLNVDVLDIIVEARSPQLDILHQEAIDKVFSDLPEDLPLVDRIWEAHLSEWRKMRYSQELLHFIHDNYFEI